MKRNKPKYTGRRCPDLPNGIDSPVFRKWLRKNWETKRFEESPIDEELRTQLRRMAGPELPARTIYEINVVPIIFLVYLEYWYLRDKKKIQSLIKTKLYYKF